MAAGKLAALLSRRQARDLFDSVRILQAPEISRDKLRLALVVYCALNRENLIDSSPASVTFNPAELAQKLVPTLRVIGDRKQRQGTIYGSRSLVEDCRVALSSVLPFTELEREFLRRVCDLGEVAPELLTADESLQDRIRRHPALAWKTQNVRQHKGLP